jgi:hypothetical protein
MKARHIGVERWINIGIAPISSHFVLPTGGLWVDTRVNERRTRLRFLTLRVVTHWGGVESQTLDRLIMSCPASSWCKVDGGDENVIAPAS